MLQLAGVGRSRVFPSVVGESVGGCLVKTRMASVFELSAHRATEAMRVNGGFGSKRGAGVVGRAQGPCEAEGVEDLALEQGPCGDRCVRHEALCNRERMKGPLRGSVAADR